MFRDKDDGGKVCEKSEEVGAVVVTDAMNHVLRSAAARRQKE